MIPNRKLGKLPFKEDERNFKMATLLSSDFKPPSSCDYEKRIGDNPWGIMKNDLLGDCTCAAAGHMIMEWTDGEVIPTDGDIIKAYSAVSGYNPTTGQNDNGAVEADVLKYWRKTGIANHQIAAYVQCDVKNHVHIKACVELFGAAYIGLGLPITAQGQVGKTWRVEAGNNGQFGSWGGHAVPIVAYNRNYLWCVTWGMMQKMTWGFWNKYCDESWAVLSQDWVANPPDNSGFDLATLQSDLKALA